MALNDAIDGGEEPCKSPMKGVHSQLGANSLGQTRKIKTNNSGQQEIVIVEDQTGDLLEVGSLAIGQTAAINDNTNISILTFTAIGGPKKISNIAVSGEAAADFWIELNTVNNGYRRTTHDKVSENFLFGGNFIMAENDVLVVKVNHCATGKTKVFEATVYGV